MLIVAGVLHIALHMFQDTGSAGLRRAPPTDGSSPSARSPDTGSVRDGIAAWTATSCRFPVPRPPRRRVRAPPEQGATPDATPDAAPATAPASARRRRGQSGTAVSAA